MIFGANNKLHLASESSDTMLDLFPFLNPYSKEEFLQIQET